MELKYIGGVYGGNVKPAPFLCLILKMLQIQPEKDIIVEFISQPDFKLVFVHFSRHILSLGNIALMMGLLGLGLGPQGSGALCCQNVWCAVFCYVMCSGTVCLMELWLGRLWNVSHS